MVVNLCLHYHLFVPLFNSTIPHSSTLHFPAFAIKPDMFVTKTYTFPSHFHPNPLFISPLLFGSRFAGCKSTANSKLQL